MLTQPASRATLPVFHVKPIPSRTAPRALRQSDAVKAGRGATAIRPAGQTCRQSEIKRYAVTRIAERASRKTAGTALISVSKEDSAGTKIKHGDVCWRAVTSAFAPCRKEERRRINAAAVSGKALHGNMYSGIMFIAACRHAAKTRLACKLGEDGSSGRQRARISISWFPQHAVTAAGMHIRK
jgi:hypothetical protein